MKKMLPHCATLAIAGALSLVSLTAAASESHDARVLYQKGNAAFRNGDSILARDYYRKSLEKQEAFDTLCNLGRAEAEDKLFRESYEHLAYCVALYPVDPELADAREKFVELKSEVRLRLASADLDKIDAKVKKDMEERAERERILAEGPASGLDEEPTPVEPVMQKVKWKLPVVLSLAGAGVASSVFGGVMMGVSGGQKKEAEDMGSEIPQGECPDADASSECSDLYDHFKKADNTKNLGTGFLIGGGAALLSSLVVFIVVPNERQVQSAGGVDFRLPVVAASGDGVSFSLSGTF